MGKNACMRLFGKISHTDLGGHSGLHRGATERALGRLQHTPQDAPMHTSASGLGQSCSRRGPAMVRAPIVLAQMRVHCVRFCRFLA